MKALQAKLKAARAKANDAYYGNGKNKEAQEYVAAMAVVKALCEKIDAATPKTEYTSIDGDIFN